MPSIDGTLLTFDLAASTGMAFGHPDQMPQFSSHQFASTGDNFGKHQEQARDWIAAALKIHKPVLVGYEQPSIFGKTTPATTIKLCSYASTLEELCRPRNFNVRVRQLNPSSMKKYFTDNGKAKKDLMVKRAWDYGFRVINDDEADAIAAWFVMVECFGSEAQKQRFHDMRFKAGMGVPSPMVF